MEGIRGFETARSYEDEKNEQQAPQNNLDRDAFLKLLTTQLSNQDPLNPMEDREFIAQTAHFTSLEQMQSLNEKTGKNHEEIMEQMMAMNKTIVSTQQTIADNLTGLTGVLEKYLKAGSSGQNE